MRVVNLTPHDIVVRNKRGEMSFPPSGIIARVEVIESEKPVSAFHADNGKETFEPGYDSLYIEVYKRTYLEIKGIPERAFGVVYIVSNPCLEHSERTDIFAPDTGPTAIRNEAGNVVAVTRLLGNERR